MVNFFIFLALFIFATVVFKLIEFIELHRFVNRCNILKSNYNFFKMLQRTGSEKEISDYRAFIRGQAICIVKYGRKRYTKDEKAKKLLSDIEVISYL